MPHIRISNSKVGSIVPPLPTNGKPCQELYRDNLLQGFGLRVSSSGAKSYFIEKRINGKNSRITIGRHGQITPEQARKEAQRLLGEITFGKNPLIERKQKALRSTTLGKAYHDYLQARKNLKPKTLDDYKQCIERSLGDWLETPLTEITKDIVAKRHRKLGNKSPARANNTMRVLRAIFNFAIEEYEDQQGNPTVMINPVSRLSKTRAWYDIRRKQTLLTPTQLKPWYDATLRLNQETTRDFLHFLLFTGLRRNEAARMMWDDVNFDEGSFIIPDTKNKEPHRLPMSDFLRELLQRRHLLAEKIWVFPSPLTDTHLKEPRTAVEKVSKVSGIEFTLHDLRRTFITIAESLDIPAYALKRLLNHKFSNDVTAGYIVPSIERLRDPMQRITDYIQGKVNG